MFAEQAGLGQPVQTGSVGTSLFSSSASVGQLAMVLIPQPLVRCHLSGLIVRNERPTDIGRPAKNPPDGAQGGWADALLRLWNGGTRSKAVGEIRVCRATCNN